MEILRILMPYNFTSYEEKGLEFLIKNFAHREDVRITLFHSYTPVPPIDMSSNPEMKKMTRGIAFLSEETRRKEEGLNLIKERLQKNGFREAQLSHRFKKREKSVADEIIAAARNEKADLLVLSRQPGKVARLFARSVHTRVLSTLKNVTVCIPI